MKKFFLAALTGLALLLLPITNGFACTTMQADSEMASQHGFTQSVEMLGTTASQFLDAYAKVHNTDRNVMMPIDAVAVRTNPEKKQTFIIAFNDGCLVGSQSVDDETMEQINQTLKNMSAGNG